MLMLQSKFTAPLLFIVILGIATLGGCGTVPDKKPEQITAAKVEPTSAESMVSQAQLSSDPERSRLLLKAALQLDKEGQKPEALALLDQIRFSALTVAQQEQLVLLGARLSVEQGRGKEALGYLQRVQPPLFQQTNLKVQQRLSELRARAYALQGDNLLSAMERVFAAGLYSGDAYWSNHDKIWAALTKAPTEELQHAFNESIPGEFKGWLDLALLMRQSALGLEEQLQAVRSWQRQWPQHPAAKRLPEELRMLADLREERPQNIALAIPLSGSLAAAGIAIRDGFLTAYYADPHRTSRSIRIEIFDSNVHADFAEFYRSLAKSQYDLVVGPLEKNAVNQLANLAEYPIPVLVLNYSDVSDQGNKPVYQFGLAIEDEIAQTIEQAWNNGHRRAAIIVPDSPWGQRAQQAFAEGWQQRGGTLLKTAMLVGNSDYSKEIKDLLAVEESQARSREISQLIGENVKADPRRRRDIDCIFLAAPPIIARQVKPLLAFHYGGDIPVYATSQVFTGRINTDKDQDLDGIYFVDLPWVLRNDTAIKDQMLAAWQDQAYDRLYAFGVDAYRLAPRLELMQQFPDSSLQGMTGNLSLGPDHQIRRQLDWARFRSGRPAPADFSGMSQP